MPFRCDVARLQLSQWPEWYKQTHFQLPTFLGTGLIYGILWWRLLLGGWIARSPPLGSCTQLRPNSPTCWGTCDRMAHISLNWLSWNARLNGEVGKAYQRCTPVYWHGMTADMSASTHIYPSNNITITSDTVCLLCLDKSGINSIVPSFSNTSFPGLNHYIKYTRLFQHIITHISLLHVHVHLLCTCLCNWSERIRNQLGVGSDRVLSRPSRGINGPVIHPRARHPRKTPSLFPEFGLVQT